MLTKKQKLAHNRSVSLWSARNKGRRLAIQRKYREENREEILTKRRAYYAANRERHKENNRKSYKKNAAKRRASWNKYRAANKDLLRSQRGLPEPTRPEATLCECCGRLPGLKGMCLDHSHITGEFRGWLCSRCNTGIGYLGDDINGLLRGMRYLNRADLL
jgi:hypothetical protein